MLGSLMSTTTGYSHDQDEAADQQEDPTVLLLDHHHDHQQQNPLVPVPRSGGGGGGVVDGLINSRSPVTHMRQLLIRCAELVSQSDFPAAHRLVTLLFTTSSPYGDSTDRLVHQFSRALSLRINRHISLFRMNNLLINIPGPSNDHHHHHHVYSASSSASASTGGTTSTTTTTTHHDDQHHHHHLHHHHLHHHHDDIELKLMMIPSSTAPVSSAELMNMQLQLVDHDLQSSYLSLNQITPFIRFSHLTANQAILEAIEGQQSVHILDFDTMHGVQWPPLMQAIAERSDPSNPPMIRITGTGQNLETLLRTGDRLQKFAQSLGLKFQFHPLLLNEEVLLLEHDHHHRHDHKHHQYCPAASSSSSSSSSSCNCYKNNINIDDHDHNIQGATATATGGILHPSSLAILPDETLAVNCVLYLHRLLRDDDDENLRLFLRSIKAMKPKVVTVAEREGNHNHPNLLRRFVEALDHYTALFDSLEATLPPNSRERLSVEQMWFGREIVDIVSSEGVERRERHEKLESWGNKLNSSGFRKIPLSPFALSQAKLLLRLHYPSEGYQLQILNDSFFLGWQNQPLFTVSSWY